jgi:hypothetical protein
MCNVLLACRPNLQHSSAQYLLCMHQLDSPCTALCTLCYLLCAACSCMVTCLWPMALRAFSDTAAKPLFGIAHCKAPRGPARSVQRMNNLGLVPVSRFHQELHTPHPSNRFQPPTPDALQTPQPVPQLEVVVPDLSPGDQGRGSSGAARLGAAPSSAEHLAQLRVAVAQRAAELAGQYQGAYLRSSEQGPPGG